ncbi:MAG: MBOAT family O-acyltransferase [Eubacteriales bacterium]
MDRLPARDAERIRRSALLLLWGLCEKLLIADRIAIPVNAVYSQFGAFGGVEIILATVLYAFQIYCDFAGYTDMARGIAGMLGFDLLANFKRPYLADSVQDFWRRWHLSLSSWLRDYVYIPLAAAGRGVFGEPSTS